MMCKSYEVFVLYEFLIKRLKAFYSAAGLRPAATAAKKRSQYISYRRPGGLPWNGFHKMMKSFYEEIVLFYLTIDGTIKP